MLVNKLNKNDVVVVKLENSEEVIGRLHEEFSGEEVKVMKPLVLTMMPGAGGQIGIGLAPFLLGADTNKEITLRKYIVVEKANKDVSNMYTQATSSIAVPSGLDLSGLKQ